MRDRGAQQGHVDQVLLRILSAIADRFGNFSSLAHAGANAAFFVADHDQRGEAEIPAALNNLGNTVDGNELLFEFADLFHALHAFVLLLRIQVRLHERRQPAPPRGQYTHSRRGRRPPA